MQLLQKLICLLPACLLFLACSDNGTVYVYSEQMGKKIKNMVILPENYSDSLSYPVLYLLHGYNEDHTSFLKIKPELKDKSTEYGIIMVCPDAGYNYYWDSPVNTGLKYETYITRELVEYIDLNYSTIPFPQGRAVSGYSLGGQGSIWLAMNHPDVFGACGSVSGIMDIRPFSHQWRLKNVLGDIHEYPEVWDKYTVIENVDMILPGSLAMIIDCGTEDFALETNHIFHNKLNEKGIAHEYLTRKGDHNYKYWAEAFDDQIIFFYNFFNKKNLAF